MAGIGNCFRVWSRLWSRTKTTSMNTLLDSIFHFSLLNYPASYW